MHGHPLKSKRSHLIHIYCGLLLCLTVLSASPLRAAEATEHLKGTLDRLIKVLMDPALKTPENQSQRLSAIHTMVNEMFAQEEIAKKALGAHWSKRTQGEQQEFAAVFIKLLEQTYIDKIDAYLSKSSDFSAANILYTNEKRKAQRALVETTVNVTKDISIPVKYLLINKNGTWFIYDVAIEGISIVKNYRAQFSEILANTSFKDMMAQLKSKIQQG